MGAIIKIADVTIQQDQQGRYRLNDLHKAAGSEAKHKPANWLRLDATIGLCAEIDQFSDMSSAQVVNGGTAPGTYVCNIISRLGFKPSDCIDASINHLESKAVEYCPGIAP